MSNLENNKDIMQEIMDEQKKLDRNIIKQHDLFNASNEVDLKANFDEERNRTLWILYATIRSSVGFARKVGAKWWKQQAPVTDNQLDEIFKDSETSNFEEGEFNNISLKNLAIIQELMELEEAVKQGKPKDEIHDEFVDIIHFVVSLGLDLGIDSAEKLRQLYLKKNHVNHQRQQSNY
jgi:dimeric dUTPase (all-alpha-NTP-PPase superfamily)